MLKRRHVQSKSKQRLKDLLESFSDWKRNWFLFSKVIILYILYFIFLYSFYNFYPLSLVRTADIEYDIIHSENGSAQVRFNWPRLYHHGYMTSVLVYAFNTTAPSISGAPLNESQTPILNVTNKFHYHGLTDIELGLLHPYRNASVGVSVVSHFGHSKTVIKVIETPKDGMSDFP